mgnify:FL=1|tara:strand:+ start:437 stop:904 length:468 start_codon:yes stop_codon:yes gene_type:complete
MTQIYNYDKTTGEYFSTTTAKVDPLDGSLRIPACATTTALPHLDSNQCSVWDGSGWVVTPDHRGTTYWVSHLEEVTIKDIGVTAPEGSYSTQPDKTTEELAAGARLQRDLLLGASDQYALVDRSTEAWLSYRVLLRDVPAQEGFPDTITWPTKPS